MGDGIAALSVSMNQQSLKQDVGISVMKMAMDQASEQSAALTELMDTKSMEMAAQPYLGANFDIGA